MNTVEPEQSRCLNRALVDGGIFAIAFVLAPFVRFWGDATNSELLGVVLSGMPMILFVSVVFCGVGWILGRYSSKRLELGIVRQSVAFAISLLASLVVLSIAPSNLAIGRGWGIYGFAIAFIGLLIVRLVRPVAQPTTT